MSVVAFGSPPMSGEFATSEWRVAVLHALYSLFHLLHELRTWGGPIGKYIAFSGGPIKEQRIFRAWRQVPAWPTLSTLVLQPT